jgi:hypothetical protein
MAFPGQTSSISGASAASAALPALNPTVTHANIKTRCIAAVPTISAASHPVWALSAPSADRSRTRVQAVLQPWASADERMHAGRSAVLPD